MYISCLQVGIRFSTQYLIKMLTNLNLKRAKLLSHMNTAEKQEFLNSFDAVFCDCDGVIWHILSGAIPGAADAINKLKCLGKKVVFVTNNSICSTAKHILKFAECNIQVNQEDIVHPAQTVCNHLKSINFEGLIFCMASQSFKAVLKNAGFQVVEENQQFIDNIKELHEAIYSKDLVKAVVIDVDFNLTAVKLLRAQVHLKNTECLFIAGAADSLINFGSSEIIGPGAFIQILEESTKRKAIVLGKPGEQLRNLLKQHYYKTNENRVLFIGDSLISDIRFGKVCGFKTLLVLSGGAKLTDLTLNLQDSEIPDYVANSLADLI